MRRGRRRARAPAARLVTLMLLGLTLQTIATATGFTASLEARQPRSLAPNSTRGFHRYLHLHTPLPSLLDTHLPSFARLLRQGGLLRAPAQTVRLHDVQLHGGLVAVGEYYARVKLGGQTLRVQIDTGSATLAVPMAECSNCKAGDMRYDHAKSNSGIASVVRCADAPCMSDTCSSFSCGGCSSKRACCAKSDKNLCAFHLNFGDGSGAKGILVRDNLKWGDVEFPVTFGGIRSDSPDFERSQVDGILGMAYPSLACNPSCITPTFEAMLAKYKMRDLFTICITYDSGRIVFGDYDPAMSSKEIHWVSLREARIPDFYAFPLVGNLKVGGVDLRLPSYSRAIVDSGTTLIVFSHKTFDKFKHYLQQHFCHVPGLCDTDSWFRPAHCTKISDADRRNMPDLTFSVKGFDITLGPDEYLINYASKGPEFWCVGIMSLDAMSGGVDVIFGNTVMKKYVTVYDRENSRVGFALSDKNCALPGPDATDATLPVPFEPQPDTDADTEAAAPQPDADHDGEDTTAAPPQSSSGDETPANPHKKGAATGPEEDAEEDVNSPACTAALNCSACSRVTSANCFWDTPLASCVDGDAPAFMCTLDSLAGKLVYVVGGALAAAVVVIAIVVVVVQGYRKRNSPAPADEDEEREVARPLAPHEAETRDAFAIEDEEAEEGRA